MVDFIALYFDYKPNSDMYDTEFMKQKANKLVSDLKERYGIKSQINLTNSRDSGKYVCLECETEDKKLGPVFNMIKKTKPYSIRTSWREG